MTHTPSQMPDEIYGWEYGGRHYAEKPPVDPDSWTFIKYIRADLANTRAESVPIDKDVVDIVDKAYIFLCNKLNDYQAKDSSRPASFYTDLKPSMLWAVEYLAKEGYIKTAPDQSDKEGNKK